jgi:mono/diheme cytochrome c family protein
MDTKRRLSTWAAGLALHLATFAAFAAPGSDLLGSSHGGHYWFDYCEGKPDATPLPGDPRSLVVPTSDRAVAFNVGWHACLAHQPATCGALRAEAAQGARIVHGNGDPEAGWQFGSGLASGPFSIPAARYNLLWLRWGLLSRPANYDQMLAERYGTPLGATRNPYPLPGEDPNLTNGGSGQLPMAMTQTRLPDGRWSGQIGVTCAVCHGGEVGKPTDGPGLGPLPGNAGLTDVNLLLGEWGHANQGFSLLSLNRVRGSGNITNFQMFALLTLLDAGTWPAIFNPPFWISGSSGSEDAPNWWNLGHRPAKFFDAGMSTDSTRIELSWYMPHAATPLYQLGYDWILDHEAASNSWLLSVKAPAYPLSVDVPLAEQGAVLFHTLDLWAPGRHNPVRRPDAGNGSCASCHGAYAKRYVDDPAFLATPLLEGMAGYVTSIDIIQTDPARMDANSAAVEAQARLSFFGYDGKPGCAEEYNAIGYLAQPLYGVWASAPYFHNGSVPTVQAVLKSSDRPAFWRRLSKPARPGFVMGFETDLARGYDPAKLGWKYDVLACGANGLSPYLSCNPSDPFDTPLVQAALSLLFANGSVAWNVLGVVLAPAFTREQIEDRKIYNTRMYSQSNAGHVFTDVLTDAERAAIIEYLKTL